MLKLHRRKQIHVAEPKNMEHAFVVVYWTLLTSIQLFSQKKKKNKKQFFFEVFMEVLQSEIVNIVKVMLTNYLLCNLMVLEIHCIKKLTLKITLVTGCDVK